MHNKYTYSPLLEYYDHLNITIFPIIAYQTYSFFNQHYQQKLII